MTIVDRLSVHSHVIGLGIDNTTGEALFQGHGLIGQTSAREALGLVAAMVRNKKLAGRVILLAGPSGTGKTAMAVGLHAELGKDIPFVHLNGSEIYSNEVCKSEVLTCTLRKAIGISLKESKQVYEGEVVDISPEETENPHGGVTRTLSAVVLTLRTTKGSKSLRLAPVIHDALTREKVAIGDIIYIESGTGVVSRVGKCDRFANAYDLELDQFAPLPKGDVLKKKDIVQSVSLHDMDVANVKPIGGKDLASIVTEYTQKGKTELTEKLRTEINKMVEKYIEEGIANIVPGVVFIDEAHMLDLDSFSFLNRALESDIAPILILATNRGRTYVRDTDNPTNILSPHGIPPDFLERVLIIPTKPYTIEEIVQVVTVKTKDDGLELDTESAQLLASIAVKTSLRYVLSILQPARIIASLEGRPMNVNDIKEADSLYYDAYTSSVYLSSDTASKYISN